MSFESGINKTALRTASDRPTVQTIADRKAALRRKAAEIEAQWTEQEAHEEASTAKKYL